MKQIIIFPRGALTPKDRERLSRNGYCPIEADDPSKVILPLPSGAVTGDLLSDCALEAMNVNGYMTAEAIRARFTTELTKRLRERTP